MSAKPKTIDEYLAAVGDDKRGALEKLRKLIQAAAPAAEECISYGLAAFRLNGKPLVGFGASANHCSFFPMDSTTVAALTDDLKGFDTSKGTIRFAADKPLPASLVRMIVKARIAANTGTNTRTDPAVIAFLRELKHPQKKAIEAVRQIILGVSPEIREGIKWNAPSFRTTDWFATLNLRQARVWLILHTGAKKGKKTPKIADPSGLMKRLAADRFVMTFESTKDVEASRLALAAIVRAWTSTIAQATTRFQ